MRLKQIARTRTDILRAAIDLFKTGERFSVAEAASRAKVSRATAYRYFPTSGDLLREAVELAASRLPGAPSAPPHQLDLKMLISDTFATTLHNEKLLREMLKYSLQGINDRPECKARRATFLEAFSRVRVNATARDVGFLKDSLFFLTTIEALLVAKDECGLNKEQAEDLIRWMSNLILLSSEKAKNESTYP